MQDALQENIWVVTRFADAHETFEENVLEFNYIFFYYSYIIFNY